MYIYICILLIVLWHSLLDNNSLLRMVIITVLLLLCENRDSSNVVITMKRSTHAWTHVRTHAHTHIHTHTRARMHACTHARTHILTHKLERTRMHARTHTWLITSAISELNRLKRMKCAWKLFQIKSQDKQIDGVASLQFVFFPVTSCFILFPLLPLRPFAISMDL